jgi:hypothetical protein
MHAFVGADAAAARLRTTALRNFAVVAHGTNYPGEYFQLKVPWKDAPVPALLRLALELIGVEPSGPAEKVAWSAQFEFNGESCTIAHAKFGVRMSIKSERPEGEAVETLRVALQKLTAAVPTVERMILESAPETLARGDVTISNQHRMLRRGYEYFRQRCESPAFVADVDEEGVTSQGGKWYSHTSGANQMSLNAFHDLVAATSAYVSFLEHVMVLALPFCGYEPKRDDLSAIIGDRWGLKWSHLFADDDAGSRLRQRLTEVLETWRHPYSHGGFEKGNTATLFLHTPGVGALPIGMSRVRDSPQFSLFPAAEEHIEDVFALFDEIDEWLEQTIPFAMEWIRSGLPVRFDEDFRDSYKAAVEAGGFADFLNGHGYRHDNYQNMDF